MAGKSAFADMPELDDEPEQIEPDEQQAESLKSPPGRTAFSDMDELDAPEITDAGPAARRSAAGMTAGPREYTDEELGIENRPLTTDRMHTRFNSKTGKNEPIVSEFAPGATDLDPTAQMVVGNVVGGAAGKIVGEGIKRVAPALAKALPNITGRVIPAATEGATAAKVQGGNPLAGAIFGAALPAASAGFRQLRAGAPARVLRRTARDLEEGASARTARELGRKSGASGDGLDPTLARNPDLRHSLGTGAKPAKSLKVADKIDAKANAALDDMYDKVEAHHAGQPASSQASVSQLLDEFDAALTRNKGDLDATTAIRRARDAVVRDFGDALGTVITPKELRKIKQTVGRQAFPPGEAASNAVKARVGRELYAPIQSQLQRLAEATPGVDAAEFVALNRDVSNLIPVRAALKEAAEKAASGRKSWKDTAKSALKVATVGGAGAIGGLPAAAVAAGALGASKAARAIGRRLDYRLAERARKAPALGQPIGPEVSASTPASVVTQIQNERGRE